jgi:TonB family protein
MGKTTLLNCFLNQIQESARTVFLFNVDSLCKPKELLSFILLDLGIAPGQSNAEMHAQLNEAIAGEARAGRILTVVIDEAQNLSDPVLEKLRMLTNFETPIGKLVQVVLAGQPQLSDKLMQPSLVQLRQRISIFCHLEPFNSVETQAYIDHHLKLAGYRGDALFTSDALKLIDSASQGVPRVINNLCFNALSLSRALKSSQVDVAVAREAIADHQSIHQNEIVIANPLKAAGAPPERLRMGLPQFRNRGSLVAAGIFLACTLGWIALSELRNRQSYIGDAFSWLPTVIARSRPQPSAAIAGVELVAEDTQKTRPSEIAASRDPTIQTVSEYAPGKARPEVLLSAVHGNETPAFALVEPARWQTALSSTRLTTTEHASPQDHAVREIMNDQLTAPRRIPHMPEVGTQLEEPPTGAGGEFNLTERDGLDAIGRVFSDRRGPQVKPESDPKVVEIPTAVADNLVISKIRPVYPNVAKAARISGKVLLEATISPTGSIESLRVLSGPEALRKAAVDAVSSWRFKPYMLNNKPTAAEFRVGVLFNLGS